MQMLRTVCKRGIATMVTKVLAVGHKAPPQRKHESTRILILLMNEPLKRVDRSRALARGQVSHRGQGSRKGMSSCRLPRRPRPLLYVIRLERLIHRIVGAPLRSIHFT